MLDRKRDQENVRDTSEQSRERILCEERNAETKPPKIAVLFRLVADFVVQAEHAAEFLREPDLTPKVRDLFLTALTTPEALNRMCSLAVACDFNVNPGGYFEETFMGPEPEDILDSLLPCLSADHAQFQCLAVGRPFDSFREARTAQYGLSGSRRERDGCLLPAFCAYRRRFRAHPGMTGFPPRPADSASLGDIVKALLLEE